MCGKDENSRLLETINLKPAEEVEIHFVADGTHSMDAHTAYTPVENDHVLAKEDDVCLLSIYPDETDFRSTQRSIIVSRLSSTGPRPRMENDDADDEAQPMKPSTGQSAYLSHQENDDVEPASRADDSSVLNGSVCSSVVTVASMSFAVANSVASSTTNSVASSTATPRVSNRGYLTPSGTQNKYKMQADVSISSSTTTEKISNLKPVPAPLRSGTNSSEMDTSRDTNAGNYQNGHFEALRFIRSTPAIAFHPTARSAIYSIEEDQNIAIPSSMRAISMLARPTETDALSTMSEPKKPTRTQESATPPLDIMDHTSKPHSFRRKMSESSQNTEQNVFIF